MRHLASVWAVTVAVACVLSCVSQPPPAAACAQPPVPLSTNGAVASSATPQAGAAGTWLFRCCDGASTWVGMLAIVDDLGALHGAWLTDGDSHGSYVEGRIHGAHVELWRRWRTGDISHEQIYDLMLDESGQRLTGSFREPA